MKIKQWPLIKYLVGFNIVSDKFGIVMAKNDFLPKCVENWHCD